MPDDINFSICIMEGQQKHTLSKAERLNSLILIEKLFSGSSRSLPAFPLRIVYMPIESEHLPCVSVLISVPKKRFKHAVKRNLVKRQIREAYRKNKSLLTAPLEAGGKKAAIAFIWLDNDLRPTAEVEEKVKKLLQLTAERLV